MFNRVFVTFLLNGVSFEEINFKSMLNLYDKHFTLESISLILNNVKTMYIIKETENTCIIH